MLDVLAKLAARLCVHPDPCCSICCNDSRMAVLARASVLGCVILTLSGCGRSESDVLEVERTESIPPVSESPADAHTVVGESIPVTIEVPPGWTDAGEYEWLADDPEATLLGTSLVAGPDVHAFVYDTESGWTAPGIQVSVSGSMLQYMDIPVEDKGAFFTEWAQIVASIDQNGIKSTCVYGGVSDVGLGNAFGLHRVWTGCANGRLTIADLWLADRATMQVVFAVVVVPGEDSVELARSILDSIQLSGSPLVEMPT